MQTEGSGPFALSRAGGENATVTKHPGIDIADITGLLLAGGLGRRMGGADKGLVPLGGTPMAQQTLDRLRPQVSTTLVNANRNLEQWAAFGLPVVSDAIGGFSGPLAGVHAGLLACNTPWLVTVPCDSPYFPTDLVERLALAAATSNAELAVARCKGRLQPVFILLRRELTERLAAYLADGGRKIDAWFDELDIVVVDFDDPAAFANINTPDDLARAEPSP